MPGSTRMRRRDFLARTAGYAVGAGMLMPLWEAVGSNGEIDRAYPDELLSIEAYTGGKISPGDLILSLIHISEPTRPY